MFENKTENVEVYFICYKKEDMELVESYYDPVLDTHNWYFNAYLAYKYWQEDYQNNPNMGNMTKMLLTVAASRYIIYRLENQEYESADEEEKLQRDLKKIQPKLEHIIEEDELLSNLF